MYSCLENESQNHPLLSAEAISKIHRNQFLQEGPQGSPLGHHGVPVYLWRTPAHPVKLSDPTHYMDSAAQALRRGDWPHACPGSELSHDSMEDLGIFRQGCFQGASNAPRNHRDHSSCQGGATECWLQAAPEWQRGVQGRSPTQADPGPYDGPPGK